MMERAASLPVDMGEEEGQELLKKFIQDDKLVLDKTAGRILIEQNDSYNMALYFWKDEIIVSEECWDELLDHKVLDGTSALVCFLASQLNLDWSHRVVRKLWANFSQHPDRQKRLPEWRRLLSLKEPPTEVILAFLEKSGRSIPAGEAWGAAKAKVLTSLPPKQREEVWATLNALQKEVLGRALLRWRIYKKDEVGNKKNRVPAKWWVFSGSVRWLKVNEEGFIQSLSEEEFSEVVESLSQYMPAGLVLFLEKVTTAQARRWPKNVAAALLGCPNKEVRFRALNLLGQRDNRVKI